MVQGTEGSEKLCVITGTSSGIGLGLARRLLKKGWRVIGVARREAPLEHAAYTHLRLDLADLKAVQRTVETEILPECVKGQVGRVGLVNNAALLDPILPVARMPLESLQRAYTVNSVVPMWLMGVFLRTCAGKPLRIVNLSSGAARNARAGWGAYCSTKAALLMAGKVWAAEAEAEGKSAKEDSAHSAGDTALFSFEPGVVDTAMQTQIRGTSSEDFPSVARFVDLHEQGNLKSIDEPAKDIITFLEHNDGQPYRESPVG